MNDIKHPELSGCLISVYKKVRWGEDDEYEIIGYKQRIYKV